MRLLRTSSSFESSIVTTVPTAEAAKIIKEKRPATTLLVFIILNFRSEVNLSHFKYSIFLTNYVIQRLKVYYIERLQYLVQLQ